MVLCARGCGAAGDVRWVLLGSGDRTGAWRWVRRACVCTRRAWDALAPTAGLGVPPPRVCPGAVDVDATGVTAAQALALPGLTAVLDALPAALIEVVHSYVEIGNARAHPPLRATCMAR